MTNQLALPALTETLRDLIMEGVTLSNTNFTTKPLHKARTDQDAGNQINLFLYQTAANAAWQSNLPINHPGEPQQEPRPLALNLYYLVTAYGQGDDGRWSHQLLGEAMSVLHHHSVLSKDKIKRLEGSDLHEQAEQIRITPHPLSLEDMSKLWNIVQAPYNISVAYQVSVVLIR